MGGLCGDIRIWGLNRFKECYPNNGELYIGSRVGIYAHRYTDIHTYIHACRIHVSCEI